MRFKVLPLRRNGRRLPWREVQNGPAYVGELTTYAVDHRGERYQVATLALTSEPMGEKPIPDLFEPVLLAVSTLAFRLRGFERVGQRDNTCGVVQEWHVEAP
jgi:hypothetical protein